MKKVSKSSKSGHRVVGYIRVSTDEQDLSKQKHLLLEYAHDNGLRMDEIVQVESSSRSGLHDRKIDELLKKLGSGDLLVVPEISRLGRNMLEVLNIISSLTDAGVRIVFVRQPELSTSGPHSKLLVAIYGYFAEAEREMISLRTKQALAAAKARGKILGRKAGSRNRKTELIDTVRPMIAKYLKMGISVSGVAKIVSGELGIVVAGSSMRFYIGRDKELSALRGKQ